MRLKKKYRNLLKFMAVTLILILTISVVAAAKQHIDNKKSNHNQDIEEDYPDEDAEAYELPERTLNSDVIPYDGVPRTISCWGDSMMFGMGAGEAYIVFGDDEPLIYQAGQVPIHYSILLELRYIILAFQVRHLMRLHFVREA